MSQENNTPDFVGRSGIRSAREQSIKWLLFGCAALSVAVTTAIVATLLFDAIDFFLEVSPMAFFFGTTWSPTIDQAFGVVPLVAGTLFVTVLSACIAIPVGVASATYLSEYASRKTRSIIKPALEILAGIPTVVYGYFALVYLTPALEWLGLPLSTFNALSASIMIGIMIIPMVSSLSEDAMSAVPDSLRQAGYGMGATKLEVSTGVVIPAAASGIFSSFILALSRAIGETMIVVVAAGMRPRLVPSPFESLEVMTAAMVQLVTTDIAGGSTAYRAMFAIGITLFAITFAMNLASTFVASRYREEYQ
ncbi:phosphate ABC transporter permease [Haloprofundus marisrubri]|uniref:Phosphate transport system permease protein n=1 Tax=Haloprofundus marisrubri TaxID=1514971 RepID=A0A0W1R839_9EURY|nr:phosphate ABC transporter permease subunit PstC [Haloprofundus marisrubri]KTG09314.1 phosphate ABC transporter permease [Haloprofundus marisrubri]